MTGPTTIKLQDGNAMPQLDLGVQKASNEEVITAIHKALEMGHRSIGIAATYKNEEDVSKAIRDAGAPWDGLFITTKLWNDGQKCPRGTLFESMEKLQFDYLDLYLMH